MGAKRVLFLDDRSKRLHAALKKYAPPEYGLTLVCTVRECKKMIDRGGRWDIISLDHDLNFTEYSAPGDITGMEVIRYLCEDVRPMCPGGMQQWLAPDCRSKPADYEAFDDPEYIGTRIIVHSSNQPTAYSMTNKLKIAGLVAKYERFTYD